MAWWLSTIYIYLHTFEIDWVWHCTLARLALCLPVYTLLRSIECDIAHLQDWPFVYQREFWVRVSHWKSEGTPFGHGVELMLAISFGTCFESSQGRTHRRGWKHFGKQWTLNWFCCASRMRICLGSLCYRAPWGPEKKWLFWWFCMFWIAPWWR